MEKCLEITDTVQMFADLVNNRYDCSGEGSRVMASVRIGQSSAVDRLTN